LQPAKLAETALQTGLPPMAAHRSLFPIVRTLLLATLNSLLPKRLHEPQFPPFIGHRKMPAGGDTFALWVCKQSGSGAAMQGLSSMICPGSTVYVHRLCA
jgi:hypothetical protein